MFLARSEVEQLTKLLKTFFILPYSTDLDGKDAEKLLRIIKGATGRLSRRKELFDIIDGDIGYSVKTLNKTPKAVRVDLQEQRFCDVKELQKLIATGTHSNENQGKILLSYMRNRDMAQMKNVGVSEAKSLILLKHWNSEKTEFEFKYWEEDFLGYIDELWNRNISGEIEWISQAAGIHARDRLRFDKKGKNVRLLRMHPKHNQIFTDHDIPADAVRISFSLKQIDWLELSRRLNI